MKGQFAYVFGMQFEKKLTKVQMNSIWFAYVYFEVKEMIFRYYCKFSSVVHLALHGDTTDFVVPPGPGFQMSWSLFCVQRIEVRGDCSFC